MFLLISIGHFGAHLDGHQHGVFIQISINFEVNVSSHTFNKKNFCDLNLDESLCIFTFFIFPVSGLNLLNGFDFLFRSILDGVTLKTSKNKKNEGQLSGAFLTYLSDRFYLFWVCPT